MSAHLDEYYFKWLIEQITPAGNRYKKVCDIMYHTEFIWFVPNDDNRIEDGKDLRNEFLVFEELTLKPEDDYWMELGCSVLELIIGLCFRLEFMADIPLDQAFQMFIENLGLKDYDDSQHFESRDFDAIEDILEDLVWRRYGHDGRGGLFPLENPVRDQREVEIWYQLNAYLIERN